MREAVGVTLVCAAAIAGMIWCFIRLDDQRDHADQQQLKERREGPCKDESMLLATTSGSPSYFACPNRLHEMQVQVATHPSNEEAAALVFCKCRREP